MYGLSTIKRLNTPGNIFPRKDDWERAERIAKSNAIFMFFLQIAGLTGLLIVLAIIGLCM